MPLNVTIANAGSVVSVWKYTNTPVGQCLISRPLRLGDGDAYAVERAAYPLHCRWIDLLELGNRACASVALLTASWTARAGAGEREKK